MTKQNPDALSRCAWCRPPHQNIATSTAPLLSLSAAFRDPAAVATQDDHNCGNGSQFPCKPKAATDPTAPDEEEDEEEQSDGGCSTLLRFDGFPKIEAINPSSSLSSSLVLAKDDACGGTGWLLGKCATPEPRFNAMM